MDEELAVAQLQIIVRKLQEQLHTQNEQLRETQLELERWRNTFGEDPEAALKEHEEALQKLEAEVTHLEDQLAEQ